MMNLYLLTRAAKSCEEAVAFVIRAEDESQARAIAAKERGDELPSAWLDSAASDCVRLDSAGEPGVICCDYIEG